MRVDNRGYLLMEAVLAVSISIMIIGGGIMILYTCLKDWEIYQARTETGYNCRESAQKLINIIRDSYGVEIIDSDNGWIKIFTSADKQEFISFKIKNKKLFVGYNSTLNSNSEFATGLKSFKVNYLPNGVIEPNSATGVRIFMVFENNKETFELTNCAAFRCK